MRRFLLLPLLVLVFLSLGIAAPDSGPFITRVDVYRHVLETDDMFVVVRYNVPYDIGPPDTIPDETIAQTFIGRFMDGTTELARVSPFSYYRRGYSYGTFSMYLDAASAPTWEGSYTVDFRGSPTLEWLSFAAETAMAGAIADDGGSQTDETAAANSAAANDMTLLPATPAVNDAYYFGGSQQFSLLTLNIGTVGAGTWTIIWEYYDGDSWEVLPGISDGTYGFTAPVGNHDVTFTVPGDWTTTTIQSISAYWIRARVYSYTSVTTQPKGTQSWVNSGVVSPFVTTSDFEWRATTGLLPTKALMYAHLVAYADELGDYWNIALTASTAAGKVLSSYGETYFTSAMPELRVMCPALFSGSTTVPQYTDVEWQKTQSEVIKATWPFDWGGMSQWLGLPSSDEVLRTLVGFVIVFVIGAAIVTKTNRTDIALIACYGLLIVAAVPGLISPVLVGGFVFMTVIAAGLVFILGKAG